MLGDTPLEFNQRNFLAALMESGNPGIPAMPTPVFSGSYPMGPDESGWEPKGPIIDLNNPTTAQTSIPAQPPPDLDPVKVAAAHEIHPDTYPLISAMDSGFADKKLMKPMDLIREGIQTGDIEMVKKGHKGLSDMVLGDQPFGEWYNETMAGRPGRAAASRRMAGDIVMREIARATGAGQPTVEEAVGLGLIQPDELLSGSQVQHIPGQAMPGYTGFTSGMEPIPAPAQEDTFKLTPNAFLTPSQQDIAESRQRGLSTGLAYKTMLAKSKTELNVEKSQTERYKRGVEGPAKLKAMESLNALREAQTNLADARVEWYQQLPGLRRELAGSPALEIDAMKRVHKAILEHKPIEKADWLIAERWLRKGSPRFSVDFMGRAFDRLTGQSERKAGPFGWSGLPEPPSTLLDEGQQAEAEQVDQDLIHQFGAYIGSLLKSITGAKEEAKPESKLSKEEQAELERLRKKHGK